MTKEKYSNLRVQITHDSDRGCVAWETPDARYHVWLDAHGQPTGGFHRNSRKETRGMDGHRELDAENKTNKALLADVMRLVAADDMIATAERVRQEREAARGAYWARKAEIGNAHLALSNAVLECTHDGSLRAKIAEQGTVLIGPSLLVLLDASERVLALKPLPKPEGI